jgi:hypothetical protein
MIKTSQNQLAAICRQRGYTLEQVQPCIVSEDGNTITIDETHEAYPRRRKGSVSLADKARNFARSAAKHLAAGMPQATDEEVAARFAICQSCEHFDGAACRKCGCPVVRQKQFLSKLSWAAESCPVGKWGPVAG